MQIAFVIMGNNEQTKDSIIKLNVIDNNLKIVLVY